MSGHDCHSDEVLAALHDRGAAAADAHLAACPRCRARLADYALWVSDAQPLDAVEQQAAADMAAAVRARLDAGAPARVVTPPVPAVPSRRRLAWPALAAAAVVVVAAGTFVTLTHAPRRERVRGATPPVTVGVFAARPPRAAPDGVVLEWGAARGADAYLVRFFGTDLVDRATLGPVTATSCRVAEDSLPPGLTHGDRVMFEVVALARGERIGRTAPRTVEVP